MIPIIMYTTCLRSCYILCRSFSICITLPSLTRCLVIALLVTATTTITLFFGDDDDDGVMEDHDDDENDWR